jgi:hypothetical protein
MTTNIPLIRAKVGDVVIDERPQTVRIPRTTKYRWIGTETVRGIVTEAACAANRYTVSVQFPEGLRGRNGQFIEVER